MTPEDRAAIEARDLALGVVYLDDEGDGYGGSPYVPLAALRAAEAREYRRGLAAAMTVVQDLMTGGDTPRDRTLSEALIAILGASPLAPTELEAGR